MQLTDEERKKTKALQLPTEDESEQLPMKETPSYFHANLGSASASSEVGWPSEHENSVTTGAAIDISGVYLSDVELKSNV
jgi:hypothetical protein